MEVSVKNADFVSKKTFPLTGQCEDTRTMIIYFVLYQFDFLKALMSVNNAKNVSK